MLPIAHCDRLPVTYGDHTLVMHDRSKDWWVRDGVDMSGEWWPKPPNQYVLFINGVLQ